MKYKIKLEDVEVEGKPTVRIDTNSKASGYADGADESQAVTVTTQLQEVIRLLGSPLGSTLTNVIYALGASLTAYNEKQEAANEPAGPVKPTE